MDSVFPFAALVGQDRMKLGLILCAVNPRVGGMLIVGEKGTAKSTAVRGLCALLSPILTVPSPFVTLPLNATEDRLVGGLDFVETRRVGKPCFQPGLLAAAHRGVLYVDEVNLLDDHLVDALLDAAAEGTVRVEREGLSLCYPSQFVLIGTMNPEEGSLRPQWLDRFGLCVRLSAVPTVNERILLMERREAFDADPVAFHRRFQQETERLARNIDLARDRLARVDLPAPMRQRIARMALEHAVPGHRADLVMAHAARALAAWEGRTMVEERDVEIAASLALPHRQRDVEPPPDKHPSSKQPPPAHPDDGSDPPQPSRADDRTAESGEAAASAGMAGEASSAERDPAETPSAPKPGQAQADRIFTVGEPFRVRRIEPAKDRRLRRGSGRRARTRTPQKQGRYVRAVADPHGADLALDATLRAAAPHQRYRTPTPGLALTLRADDLRSKVREKRVGHFVLFLVDASGSMGAKGRMTASKGAILSLLLDAYQKRDRVAMISFRGEGARTNLPPTASVELAARHLEELPVGGRTPLAAGLACGAKMVENVLRRAPTARPIVVLLTDGKANRPVEAGRAAIEEALEMAARWARDPRILFVVVDTEHSGLVRFGLARRLADALGGRYFPMEDLRADRLLDVYKRSL